MLSRRTLLAGLAAAPTAATGARAEDARSLRIGYQKNGIQVIARQRGSIEARLRPLGVAVSWVEFSYGPPMLEAMRVGGIDFGATGDAPPVFAQAARADLVYVAALPSGSSASAVLVPPGSTLRTLADLKGRRVAFAKGSSAHNLTLAALEKAGLTYDDIQPVPLAPADAAVAFLRGGVDAWTIWDPYFAIAESQPGVRVLALAKAIAPQNGFYLSSRAYARDNAPVLEQAVAALDEAAVWARAHVDEAGRIMAEVTGVPPDLSVRIARRSHFAIGPMTDAIVREQQLVADRFRKAGLIPVAVNVADATWRKAA